MREKTQCPTAHAAAAQAGATGGMHCAFGSGDRAVAGRLLLGTRLGLGANRDAARRRSGDGRPERPPPP